MTNELTQYNPKLKPYHIIIIACLLSPLLILNSNYVNSQRATEKLNKEKSKLFDQIISSRHLQENEGDEKPLSKSDKVCQKGSKELISYYKTGDLSKIGLDENKSIECEEKDKPYFKALLNIVKSLTGEGDGETDNGNQSEENHESESTRRNLLEIGEIQDDLTSYVKHLIGILIFLVIGIFSLPGWLICCFCTCCNCCCCCCCKKRNCKIPCFIFTYIFYALAVAVCIYGLSQTDKIFVGMADTECSILKFLDQVLDGETKEEMPRWAGIEGINTILDNLYGVIYKMQTDTYRELVSAKKSIEDKGAVFMNKMKTAHSTFLDSPNNYKSTYLTQSYNYDFGSYKAEGQYVLDLVNMFGRYDDTAKKFVPDNSTLSLWDLEYSTVASHADEYLERARSGFEEILDKSSETVLESLDSGKSSLEELRSSFNDIKSDSADSIYDASDILEDYGKLGSKLVFGVLGLMNVALAVFMLFICLFSGEMCKGCCCCRCIFKFFTHLLWNILALLMFVTFLVGFLFSFVGTIGEDMMNVISFVVSEDNLGKDGNEGEGILISSLGEAKSYLDRCVNGDGRIEEEIGLDLKQVDSFTNISDSQTKIEETKEQFEEIRETCLTYNTYLEFMEKRESLQSQELSLIPKDKSFKDDPTSFLNFNTILREMNQKIKDNSGHQGESWSVGDEADKTLTCSAPDGTHIFYPFSCKPSDRAWISDSSTSNEIKGRAKIISDTIVQINNVKTPYKDKLDLLKGKYSDYLGAYISALDKFGRTIASITDTIGEFIGDGSNIFGFIKCKFIGTNLKIILKYLKTALGKNIKTVGICLTVVGCSLALSISSTILLIVIINISLEDNSRTPVDEKMQGQIPEYNINNNYNNINPGTRVIQYQ